MIKLLGSNKSKITKNKDGESWMVLHLEITEVILSHCNIVNNDYQQDYSIITQSFHIFKYGLLIKILNLLR